MQKLKPSSRRERHMYLAIVTPRRTKIILTENPFSFLSSTTRLRGHLDDDVITLSQVVRIYHVIMNAVMTSS